MIHPSIWHGQIRNVQETRQQSNSRTRAEQSMIQKDIGTDRWHMIPKQDNLQELCGTFHPNTCTDNQQDKSREYHKQTYRWPMCRRRKQYASKCSQWEQLDREIGKRHKLNQDSAQVYWKDIRQIEDKKREM
jgi:hypothetical protein